MRKFIFAIITVAIAGGMSSCVEQNRGWSLSGKVKDAAEQKLALESYNNGKWYVVDSIAIDKDDAFEYIAETPASYPDVMRITLGEHSIYFPIDSLDKLVIETSAKEFGSRHSISGSIHASTLQQLDSILNASMATSSVDSIIADKELKKQLFTTAYKDPSVVSLYYLINKSIDGKQLFNLNNSADRRIYGAVAQRFITEHPDDPRTAYLKSNYEKALANASGVITEITIPETSLIDIERYDAKGVKQTLSEIASKGKVVLLSFTSYNLESSPAYNVILNNIWDKYHAAELEIYQIAFDADETMWRMRAENLPWTTVWNATTDGTDILLSYNVQALPMTYIINRKGELATRIVDPNTLETELKKFL